MGRLTKIRRAKMTAQGGRCYYCDLQMWDEAVPSGTSKRRPRALQCTAEHLKARRDGGRDTARNIVAACLFCNKARHHPKVPRTPEEHRAHVRRRMAAGRWLAGMATG